MKKIAVISPSSLLGREVVGLLAEVPGEHEVALFSERMAGAELSVGRRELVIEDLDADALLADGAPAAAIFAGVPDQPRGLAGGLVEAGTRVIDLTSAFRADARVPLLSEPPMGPVPPLVSLPGGGALAALRALEPLEALGLARLDATLLVPVSAAGAAGVRELSTQAAKLLSGGSPKPRRFPHRIAFNIHPGPGEQLDGESKSERGFRDELRRLLGRGALPLTVSTARVPVFFGLTLGLTFETERPTSLAEVEAMYRASAASGRHKLLSGTGTEPMPSLAAGDPAVLVGQLRGEGTRWQLWACVDPLRMRAELAVAIARRLL